jgi:hypothetical protein
MNGIALLMYPVPEELIGELMSVLKLLNEHVIGFYGSEEKGGEKEEKIQIFTIFQRYRVVKRKKEYYFKIKLKGKDEKFSFKEIGPMPQNIVEKIFIPMYDQNKKGKRKSKLKKILVVILKNQNGELFTTFTDFLEVRSKKIEAVKSQNFSEAAAFRDKEKDLMDKIVPIAKEKINAKRGFKWVTDAHVWEVLNELCQF